MSAHVHHGRVVGGGIIRPRPSAWAAANNRGLLVGLGAGCSAVQGGACAGRRVAARMRTWSPIQQLLPARLRPLAGVAYSWVSSVRRVWWASG